MTSIIIINSTKPHFKTLVASIAHKDASRVSSQQQRKQHAVVQKLIVPPIRAQLLAIHWVQEHRVYDRRDAFERSEAHFVVLARSLRVCYGRNRMQKGHLPHQAACTRRAERAILASLCGGGQLPDLDCRPYTYRHCCVCPVAKGSEGHTGQTVKLNKIKYNFFFHYVI